MSNTLKMETATLFAYNYIKLGQSKTIFVEKGNEHPDPCGALTWGRDITGEVVKGDFNRYFTKVSKVKPMKVTYTIQGCRTAAEEKHRRIDAIKSYIKTFADLDKAAEKFDNLMDMANGDME